MVNHLGKIKLCCRATEREREGNIIFVFLLVPLIQVIIIRLSRNHRKYISFIINYYYYV